MKTENGSNAGCLRRDNVEREGYAGALSTMASSPDTDVHMEAMEEAKDEG